MKMITRVAIILATGAAWALLLSGFVGLLLHQPTSVKPKVTVDVQGLEPRDMFAVVYLGAESQKHSLTKADAESAYDFSNTVMEIRKRK